MTEETRKMSGIRKSRLLGCLAAPLLACCVSATPATSARDASVANRPDDPVARLQARIDRGEAHLQYDDRRGWLESVLRELRVPADSQGLVFSKTSFQPTKISPRTPRAVYFNDDVYIGWVQDGTVLEIASVDPKQGTVFYSLPQKKTDHPKFKHETSACLQCHQSQTTGDVPGLLFRSVYPDSEGMPILSAGTFVTTEQSPLSERWGGWYADGKLPDPGMANAIVLDADQPDQFTRSAASLDQQFDVKPYLSAHADPVALLVLAHQTHLHNLLARAAHETTLAVRDEQAIQKLLHEGPDEHSDTTQLRIKSACEPVVEAMLFSGEAPLEGDVCGSTDFARRFEQHGPRDAKGRSLRQFDLHTRLFKYPCSYLIYSEQFDALPEAAKQYIYRRLWQVLTGRDDSRAFSHLPDDRRDSLYEILRQTKAGLPAYWKPRG
jgi:hypothetical protein